MFRPSFRRTTVVYSHTYLHNSRYIVDPNWYWKTPRTRRWHDVSCLSFARRSRSLETIIETDLRVYKYVSNTPLPHSNNMQYNIRSIGNYEWIIVKWNISGKQGTARLNKARNIPRVIPRTGPCRCFSPSAPYRVFSKILDHPISTQNLYTIQ